MTTDDVLQQQPGADNSNYSNFNRESINSYGRQIDSSHRPYPLPPQDVSDTSALTQQRVSQFSPFGDTTTRSDHNYGPDNEHMLHQQHPMRTRSKAPTRAQSSMRLPNSTFDMAAMTYPTTNNQPVPRPQPRGAVDGFHEDTHIASPSLQTHIHDPTPTNQPMTYSMAIGMGKFQHPSGNYFSSVPKSKDVQGQPALNTYQGNAAVSQQQFNLGIEASGVQRPGQSGDVGFLDNTVGLLGSATQQTATPSWDPAITGTAAALRHLFGPGRECQKITIANDDVGHVEQNRMQQLAQRIFDSILEPVSEPPNDLNDDGKEWYRNTHTNALEKCKVLMTNTTDASARCMLAVQAAVRLHRIGIPKSELKPKKAVAAPANDQVPAKRQRKTNKSESIRTITNYLVDQTSICGARVLLMADHVKNDKLIGLDVLKGDGLDDFARAPNGYAGRKRTNKKGNYLKKDLLEEPMEARKEEKKRKAEEEAEESDEPTASSSKALKKRKRNQKNQAQEEADVSDDLTTSSPKAGKKRKTGKTHQTQDDADESDNLTAAAPKVSKANKKGKGLSSDEYDAQPVKRSLRPRK